MQERLFRKSALERLSSPERLDTLMKVTQPRGWMALAVIVLGFIALGFWASVSKLPVTVAAEGELRTGNSDDQLYAVVYVPAADAQSIAPGMEVQIAPITISPQEYGYLLGEVDRVETSATTDRLARALFSQNAAYAVHILLKPDSSTPTGYRWSIGKGPDIALRPDIAISTAIILDEKRPISLLFPVFN